MCTATVLRSSDRLLVTMNRDERRTRARELPPRVLREDSGPSWIGPADGEKGGTWFGVNDRGMIACLLNAYEPGDLALFGRDGVPSRGDIIPRLLALEPRRARSWLRSGLDPSPYPSFTLVVVTADAGEVVSWRLGRDLGFEPVADGWSMVTSSFWRRDEVVAWRHLRFSEWQAAGAESIAGVPAFNLLEVAGQREWSPLMTRSFSMTRSLTQAEVQPAGAVVRLRYWCRDGESPVDPVRPTAATTLPLTELSN